MANTEIAECKHGCRLSDLSSDEEEDYFNSAAEVKLKGIVWNALNQDYLEKQALKAAAEAKRQVIVCVMAATTVLARAWVNQDLCAVKLDLFGP